MCRQLLLELRVDTICLPKSFLELRDLPIACPPAALVFALETGVLQREPCASEDQSGVEAVELGIATVDPPAAVPGAR